MDTQKDYLSKEKHTELEEELEYLTHVKRKEIAEALEAAKALGDLSENAEYHSAREAQAGVEERIAIVEEILRNAVIVGGRHKTDMVGIGSTVTLKRGKDTKTYTIVGAEESDVVSGKISNKSPLGESMMGRRKGESFTCVTPRGEEKCEIIEIK
jgi:transcription elongation factor GreA